MHINFAAFNLLPPDIGSLLISVHVRLRYTFLALSIDVISLILDPFCYSLAQLFDHAMSRSRSRDSYLHEGWGNPDPDRAQSAGRNQVRHHTPALRNH